MTGTGRWTYWFHGPAYTYVAEVLTVHDGDTFAADVDLGFSVHVQTSVRLLGCNAIELKDPGGVEARDHLAGLIGGKKIIMHTVKSDKYGGRYDAMVTMLDHADLVERLIEDGWAAPWNGVGRKPVPVWPRVTK